MSRSFRPNSIDVIRLLAAMQVAFQHTSAHLELRSDTLVTIEKLLSLYPGVPIFYFVSGFLISRSYECNSVISEYAFNRALRIYPALIVCTVFAVGSAFALGYLPQAVEHVGLAKILVWISGQISIVQFYNPEFMRHFGTGVLNGSLWTISVELQFYVLVPILYRVFARIASTPKEWNLALLSVLFLFLLANTGFHALSAEIQSCTPSEGFAWMSVAGYGLSPELGMKLLGVTFIPWFYMFIFGVFLQRNFDVAISFLSKAALLLVPLYSFVAYVGTQKLGLGAGNAIEPPVFFLLALTVFSCAYSFPRISERLLGGNDISYGIYIYHMPVVNVFIYCGYLYDSRYVALALATTVIVAALSWALIERPILVLKRHPLKSAGL
jgi:peptidoglycan/LPS O-acetylase OafA/YrhL